MKLAHSVLMQTIHWDASSIIQGAETSNKSQYISYLQMAQAAHTGLVLDSEDAEAKQIYARILWLINREYAGDIFSRYIVKEATDIQQRATAYLKNMGERILYRENEEDYKEIFSYFSMVNNHQQSIGEYQATALFVNWLVLAHVGNLSASSIGEHVQMWKPFSLPDSIKPYYFNPKSIPVVLNSPFSDATEMLVDILREKKSREEIGRMIQDIQLHDLMPALRVKCEIEMNEFTKKLNRPVIA